MLNAHSLIKSTIEALEARTVVDVSPPVLVESFKYSQVILAEASKTPKLYEDPLIIST